MTASEIRLWSVPAGTRTVPCKACGARMAYVPGKNPGAQVPVSVDSPLATRDALGDLAAPSHFTDCPAAASFSKKGKS